MSSELFDGVERVARHVVNSHATAGIGTVVETHPGPEGVMTPDHAVTVQMRDSGLVLPSVPVAVGAMGFASIPGIGDLVLIVFTNGDYNAPVVAGRIYNPDMPPPQHDDGQLVYSVPPGGATGDLNLVVAMEEPSVTLDMPGGLELSLKTDEAVLQVGEMKLTLTNAGNGEALLEAGSASIRIQNGDAIELNAASISIRADSAISIEGAQVEVKGSGSVDISGGMVNLN